MEYCLQIRGRSKAHVLLGVTALCVLLSACVGTITYTVVQRETGTVSASLTNFSLPCIATYTGECDWGVANLEKKVCDETRLEFKITIECHDEGQASFYDTQRDYQIISAACLVALVLTIVILCSCECACRMNGSTLESEADGDYVFRCWQMK